jgi:site-specific DNA-methyltransferase (adenine-specific)
MKEISPFLDLRLGDCMDLMREYPDGHFDLAIVDPPYGINFAKRGDGSGTLSKHRWKNHERKEWDANPPPPEYFLELKRVSKNRIVWGANHFIDHMPWRSPCWVMWDKIQEFSLADFELAWTSFTSPARSFRFSRGQATHEKKGQAIHPTQKPVALYSWLLANYAKPGDRILDTHLGSGSIAIACHYRQHHLTACEIDPDYYAAAMERIEAETRQLTLF